MIPFTDREIRNAWRNNKIASNVELGRKTNAHRLLLFYSIECGLKALLLKRMSLTRSDHCTELMEVGHNINKLLDTLHAGNELKIPSSLSLSKIKDNRGQYTQRHFSNKDINQIWRYGGSCINISDDQLEDILGRIDGWIGEQL